MNNDNTQTNTAFSQQSAVQSQSNPFTGDLKGEFTSDFGTNTNAVSQIFKGGGFTEDRKKAIIIGVAVLLLLAGAFFFLSTGEDDGFEEGMMTEEGAPTEEGMDDEMAGTEEAMTGGEAMPMEGAPSEAAPMEGAPAEMAPEAGMAEAPTATGDMMLSSPQDGAQQSYDETQGPSIFEWQGAADRIVFARNAEMNPIERSVPLNGASSYQFNHPHPGDWYWRVENASGASEVRRFTVNPPPRRTFPVSQPAPGTPIAGNGGVVSWQAGEKIARYQVQLKPAGTSWANPAYRFGTSGTSLSLRDVPPGQYDMRVGAFSEVSGRWEWQNIPNVSVQ